MKKSIFAAVIFGVFLVIRAEASLISFFVIETGLPEETGINQNSIIWENAFMDVFFDAGYIVSNYPMLRYETKPEGNILEISGFNVFEAKDAGVDYILISKLDYSPPAQLPESISFYVFKVDQYEIIYEKHINGKNIRGGQLANDDLKTIINELARFVINL